MSMRKVQHLNDVAELARRVSFLAATVRDQRDAHDRAFRKWTNLAVRYDGPPEPSPKLTGELRRRSMDLTRALAELRKP